MAKGDRLPLIHLRNGVKPVRSVVTTKTIMGKEYLFAKVDGKEMMVYHVAGNHYRVWR